MAGCSESPLVAIYGAIPKWVPDPSTGRVQRIIQKLLSDGFTVDGITTAVDSAQNHALKFPGIVSDPVAFIQDIHELLHLRHAISLGKLEGLACLAGDQARHGQKFKDGKKIGSVGPIRKEIAKLLGNNPQMKTPELWSTIAKKPPKGWTVCENRQGKYIEGPKVSDGMGYRRFESVVSAERKKQKITG